MSSGAERSEPSWSRLDPQALDPDLVVGKELEDGKPLAQAKKAKRRRRQCLFCSRASIERKQMERFTTRNKVDAFVQHHPSPEGLLCGLCQRFACKSCLSALNSTFTQEMMRDDQWCRDVRRYLSSATVSKLQQVDVGHCCYLKGDSITNTERDKIIKHSYLGGHLVLYEYGIVLDPPLGGSCDVHGFGNDVSCGLQGVHHAVVDPVLSSKLNSTNTPLDGTKTCLESYHPPTKITIPGLSRCSPTKTILVQWFVLRQTGIFPINRLAEGVSREDLSGCGSGFFDSKEAPLQMLLGATEDGQTYHLLNARFHDVKSIGEMSRSDQHSLFEDCKKKLKRGGFEANRKNSGGKTRTNWQLKQFLNHPGNLPRKSSGVKLFRREKDWQFLYISTKKSNEDHNSHPHGTTRKVATWKYTQPQIGGSFNCPQELFFKYPFLYDFVHCKIETALVLQVLKSDFGLVVQPGAVAAQIHQLELARDLYEGDDLAILRHVSKLNMYTLVAYPVSYHTDTFANREASLENKVCFVNPPMRQHGLGRGGAGADEFVYALLDW